MALAAAHIAAIALACFGLGLVVAAFVGEPFGVPRLFLGLGLLVCAMLVSGFQLLTHHAGGLQEET